MIGLEFEEQLRVKEGKVQAAFVPYTELAGVALEGIVGTERRSGYRLRAKLVAEAGRIGLYARGTHEVLDLPECVVVTPRIAKVAESLRRRLPEFVTAVDLRDTDEGVLVTLVADRGSPVGELEARARAIQAQAPEVVSVAVSTRDPRSAQVLGGEPRVVSGPSTARQHFDPNAPYHLASHGAFTQAHPEQAFRLHQSVIAALDRVLGDARERRVLELFGGAGALALTLAARGVSVTLVEAFEPAVRRVREAAEGQALRIETIAGDATAFAERASARYDAVIVNPPRRGLEARLREQLTRLRPELLLYVSCDPRTLARDAADFSRRGYAAVRATPFDMIPLSDAVEVLVEFQRTSPPPPRVLHETDDWIAIERSAHEMMGPSASGSSGLLGRVRALPGLAEAVAVTVTEALASGLCLFARTPRQLNGLQAALAEGNVKYSALARGVARDKGNILRPLEKKGEALRTHYKRVEVVGSHSLLEVSPVQGRPQQIQKHLASIGHPVLGDAQHGDRASNGYFWHRHGLDRAFLHLSQLTFPWSGQSFTLNSELSPDLAEVCASLRRDGSS